MAKFGVMLARFQPVHLGHISLIEKACSENDKVLILVGSIDKLNERNPIPWDIRVEMLKESLEEYGLSDKCSIIPINDLTDESDNSHDWGFYLYAKIVDIIKDSAFTMYYSDGFEIITTWFPGFLLRDYVSLTLLARGKVEKGISATDVRKAILEYDKDKHPLKTLTDMVPTSVFNRKELIKAFIKINLK
jgi:cytidyltransferase-like protein